MYALANQFVASTNLLHERMLRDGREAKTSVPFSVLAAFLTELLLKCLKVVEGGEFLKTHHLAALFADLEAGTQDVVLAKHREVARAQRYEGPTHPDVLFRQILDEVDNLFVDGRYFFELDLEETEGRYWVANPAPAAEAVRMALVEMAPGLTDLPFRITTDRADI